MTVWAHNLAQDGPPPVSAPPREALQPGALGPWICAGARAAALRPLRGLEDWQATPAVLACLVLATSLMSLLWERLAIDGPAVFQWQALASGWLDLLVLAWLCAWVRPLGVPVSRLIALALGLRFVILSVTGPWWGLLAHLGWQPAPALGYWLGWALWGLPQLWWWVALAVVFRRLGDRHWGPWLVALAASAGLIALQVLAPLPRPWQAVEAAAGPSAPGLVMSEPVLQAQATLLDRQLAALRPQRPGVIDVYVLTFAPYGEEDVFSRESAMVAEVMARRFDAQGRTLQLVNHPATGERLPWATASNLARALQGLGRIMDPREDIVFVHLTSHGARNGHLAAGLAPLRLDQVTPQGLKSALAHAGIRQRILSISACYSGSWVQPLADEASLVMTAADADHTSYGCGHLSPLTFFGRAMYDEQLRHETRSFTQAHAAAREVIRRREIEGGKDDGYSNPQIAMGAAIAPVLEALARRLSAADTPRAAAAFPQPVKPAAAASR
ncbi:MAG: hypothetical protein EOP40_13140 [Rubrivivax sp.]|nr:MAG: hypothetical protein EOP40_13140 [Rubrivivax sp.]